MPDIRRHIRSVLCDWSDNCYEKHNLLSLLVPLIEGKAMPQVSAVRTTHRPHHAGAAVEGMDGQTAEAKRALRHVAPKKSVPASAAIAEEWFPSPADPGMGVIYY